MAIEGKVSFMTQAEKRLAPELTAESLRKVLSCFSDVLFRFEIREIDADDVDFDEDALCPECGKELFPALPDGAEEEEEPEAEAEDGE